MKTSLLIRTFIIIMAIAASVSLPAATPVGGTFTVGDKTFLLNGKPFVVKAAELHYPRIPRQYWEHRIRMCRALGMNTICMYVFWNIHEQREGEFDFTGQNDIAEFCRLAQKNGMYVIVRPGPYVCAEWEMGGLPWWLLKKKDIRLREQDPYFMERAEAFINKVGEQLAPLTIQRGGPIIMVQVENEYGSYGEDKAYVSAIRDIVRRAGFSDVTLFQCDWASNFTKNGLDDLVWTMNFGTGADIDAQFSRLRELRPEAPLMCSEFWSGWFDKWGARHETRPADAMVAGIDEMLSKNISFSLYMTHGGTSFGHWAGANSPGFAPDVTSYDYDAPINEYGLPTEKYYKLRDVMRKYADAPLPDIPEPAAELISVPKFSLVEYAPLLYGIDSVCRNNVPLTFEELDMGWGTVVYATTLPETVSDGVLSLEGAHDYALVYVDGKYVGRANRESNETTVKLPAAKKGSRLAIVVEGMGRINFGRAIKDYKGLTAEVTLRADVDGKEKSLRLDGWTMLTLPDAYENATAALASGGNGEYNDLIKDSRAGYYRGYFDIEKTGDTFLNMEQWGKGQVYVNGHAVGRFWSIGPQQTLYVPGCWLNEGRNEVIVLDVVGPRATDVWGQTAPELDRLQAESGGVSNRSDKRPELSDVAPSVTGSFSAVQDWQTVTLEKPAKGRYLAVECVGTYGRDGVVTMAEIYAKGADGKRIDRSLWAVKYVDSEDIDGGNHTGDKAFDMQESTYWRTIAGVPVPHLLVIDMGKEQTVSAIEYLPCTIQGQNNGINGYKIYVY